MSLKRPFLPKSDVKQWFTTTTTTTTVKNDINSLFHLAQMAAILDFIHNAMSKVLCDYITMSGITEDSMLDTKIKNLRLFCRK